MKAFVAMEIHHYNPEDELVVSQEYPPGQEAELVVSSLCRNSLRLRPQAKYLFCLRNPSSGAWLKPDAVTKSGDVLELRLRFKVRGQIVSMALIREPSITSTRKDTLN
ncbi:Uncharacterized protein FKW44_000316 [Caligus rogercresseyi]|uniref:Uncharacterized protein n=1 Tax=Caligus rogercresseyi TaxID=217165 RepID=A0A7T8KHC2_CALRO|nr:Uncharacterized protein FKW44_000316 [Caligus rogercresseyi]